MDRINTTQRTQLIIASRQPFAPVADSIVEMMKSGKVQLVTVLCSSVMLGQDSNPLTAMDSQEFHVMRALRDMNYDLGQIVAPTTFIARFAATFGYTWSPEQISVALTSRGVADEPTKVAHIVRSILGISWPKGNNSPKNSRREGKKDQNKGRTHHSRNRGEGMLTFGKVGRKLNAFINGKSAGICQLTPETGTLGGYLFVVDANVNKATFSRATAYYAFEFTLVDGKIVLTGMTSVTPASTKYVSDAVFHDLPNPNQGYMAPATDVLVNQLIRNGIVAATELNLDAQTLVDSAIRYGIESTARFDWSRGFLKTNGNKDALTNLDKALEIVRTASREADVIVSTRYESKLSGANGTSSRQLAASGIGGSSYPNA